MSRVRLEVLLRILAAPMALPTGPEMQSTGPAHFGESGMWESRSLVLPKAPKQICRNRRHRFAESAAPNIRITRTTTTTTTPPRYESSKPPRYESGTPRYESNAGGACEVGQTNAALVLPAGLTSDESTAILRLVEPWPAQAQALLDELDARLRAGAVRTNPVAYLHGMVKRAAEGRFVPEAGRAASADRRRRRDLQAIRSRREDQRRGQQSTRTAIDRDAERAAGRAVLRQLLAIAWQRAGAQGRIVTRRPNPSSSSLRRSGRRRIGAVNTPGSFDASKSHPKECPMPDFPEIHSEVPVAEVPRTRILADASVAPATALPAAHDREREIPDPGHLTDAVPDSMTLHTREAWQLFTGRRADPARRTTPIPGGRRFASVMKMLWLLSANDNPYADWILQRVYERLDSCPPTSRSIDPGPRGRDAGARGARAVAGGHGVERANARGDRLREPVRLRRSGGDPRVR